MRNTKINKSYKLLGELRPSLCSNVWISEHFMPLRGKSTNETKVTLTWGLYIPEREREIEKFAG